ncbi:hypothetical protein BD410DRAFT_560374 [Rickenella mellea]|uniref:Uncharacterized protein n=1 Tax=Rickenella mellea TaxID=50990 RepID=A0A4Y7QF08_9AGAM|nr:hypothetical protein BD410DRAFT_560374 [Rickenella mellea]
MSLAHICSSPLTPCSPSPSKLDPPTSPVVSGPSHVVDTPFDSITTFTTNPSSLESPAISKVSQDVPKLKLPLLSIPTNALPSASSSRSASSASSSRSASPAVSIASGSKRRSFTPETRCVSHAKSEGNPRVVKRDGAQHVRKRDIDGAHVDKKMKTHKRPHHVTVSRPSSPTPSDVSSSTQKPRKKRSKKENLDSHGQSSELPAQIATSVSAPVDNNTLSPSDPPPPLAEEDADAVAKRDMRGFLIQAMAISRASSMPASSLLREVLREQPQVGAQRTKKAWLVLLSEVLSASEVFGRIEREGTDAAGKPLEPQWFYIPEKDDDQERAMLLREMMPKKRNETKKHKQYYYRPVEKISRWDAEDEP